MKDYEHIVVWLDYFNKTLPRSRGRRLGKDDCIFDPTLRELADAAREAGLAVSGEADAVRYPKRPYVRSGYIVLEKTAENKTKNLRKISKKLVLKRVKSSKQKKI